MDDRLWLPPSARVQPTEGKKEGGTHFDDELGTVTDEQSALVKDAMKLIAHLNERPDHSILVGTAQDRSSLREVFNWWKREGLIGHNPNIRIDYGVPEGAIRVGDGR